MDILFEYTDYLRFATKLNELYEARKVATGEEAIALDNEIEELTRTNEKYFSLKFFNDLSKADPETYNFLKNKYNIKVQRPETFYAGLINTMEEETVNETVEEEVVENKFTDMTDEDINKRLGELWNSSLRSGEFEDTDKEVIEYHELLDELNRRRKEQTVNPYESMTEDDINKRLSELWNIAISSGELEDSDKEVIEYHALLNELNRRRKEQSVNPYENMTEDEINKRLSELWNIAISSGEIQDEDREVIEYHELINELNRRRKEQTETVEENKEETNEVTSTEEEKLEWDSRLTEEQILDAYERGIYEPKGDEYEQFLREHGLDPIKKDVPTEPVKPAEPVQPAEPVIPVVPTKPDVPEEPTEDTTEEEDEEDKKEEVVPTSDETFTLESILAEITHDVDLSRFGRKQLVNSEIKVTRNFVNRMKQNNNWVYNIAYVVPGIVGGLFGAVKKAAGALYKLTHPGKAEDLETVRDRLRELPKEKLEVIRNEYDVGRANENSGYNAISPIVYERLIDYVETEYCQPRREELVELYKDVAEKYRGVEVLITRLSEAKSDAEKAKIERAIMLLSKGSSEKIARINQLRNEISHYYNDGKGMQSLAAAYGAVDNNSNRRGRIFAKQYTTGQASKFNKLLGALTTRREDAVKKNKDLEALRAFGEEESFKIDNTIVKNSIVGKRSVGIYNYNPVPHQEEIGPDPLFGYIIRTVGILGLAKGIVTEVQNQLQNVKIDNYNATIDTHNADIASVNAQNQAFQQQVNQAGDDLTAIGRTNVEGLEKIGLDSINGKHASKEYLDTNYNAGTYKAEDLLNHQESTTLFNKLETNVGTIQKQLAAGTTDLPTAIAGVGKVLKEITDTKKKLYAEWDNAMHNTARGQQLTSAYDYTALENSVPKLVNDTSLETMVDGMIKSANIGNNLSNMTVATIASTVSKLPIKYHSFAIPLVTYTLVLTQLENQAKSYLGMLKSNDDVEEITELFREGSDVRKYREVEKEEIPKEDEEIEKGR